MNFRQAVESVPELADAYQEGLQALARPHRRQILCNNERLTGSVNLDSTLCKTHPEEPRWDYGVGYCSVPRSEEIFWVEFHPASSTHIQEVLNKLQWLKNWLQSSATALKKMPSHFAWVASGKVHIAPNSPQRRKLAESGIEFRGSHLLLD